MTDEVAVERLLWPKRSARKAFPLGVVNRSTYTVRAEAPSERNLVV